VRSAAHLLLVDREETSESQLAEDARIIVPLPFIHGGNRSQIFIIEVECL